MSPDVPPSKTAIGATLRDARRRYGLEVREVEEQTKIRARYIRALENEDWETLPAPAYVRGFLRTYGQLLGLDGEMLADEFRRRYGDGPGSGVPTSGPPEPLLSERRRPQPPRLGRAVWVGAAIVATLVLVLILSLLGGGDDTAPGPDQPRKARKQASSQKQKSSADRDDRKRQDRKVKAVISARSATEVCLVAGGDQALIDSQVLQAGARERYDGYKNYRLDTGPGELTFSVGGDRERIETSEPKGFEADASGIREDEYQGPECP